MASINAGEGTVGKLMKEDSVYLSMNKTIEDFIKKDKNGNYPDEYQIYDYDPGVPDVSDNITKLTADFVDGSSVMFVNPIAAYENNIIVPYDGILLENPITKVSKKYQIR